jgi:hypothetical protein
MMKSLKSCPFVQLKLTKKKSVPLHQDPRAKIQIHADLIRNVKLSVTRLFVRVLKIISDRRLIAVPNALSIPIVQAIKRVSITDAKTFALVRVRQMQFAMLSITCQAALVLKDTLAMLLLTAYPSKKKNVRRKISINEKLFDIE